MDTLIFYISANLEIVHKMYYTHKKKSVHTKHRICFTSMCPIYIALSIYKLNIRLEGGGGGGGLAKLKKFYYSTAIMNGLFYPLMLFKEALFWLKAEPAPMFAWNHSESIYSWSHS